MTIFCYLLADIDSFIPPTDENEHSLRLSSSLKIVRGVELTFLVIVKISDRRSREHSSHFSSSLKIVKG